MEPKLANDSLPPRLLAYLLTTTDIIPAIKTDHAAISIEFSISEKHIKGPGHWKMNCSLLDDENYVRDVTAKIPIWLIEGQNELTYNRSIWDSFKYKIRAHAIHHLKRKAMERKEKEMNLQKSFMKENFKVSLFVLKRAGGNTARRVQNIFLI